MTEIPTPFLPNSRYFHVARAIMHAADGTEIAYLRRRFCPQPESMAGIAEHIRNDRERLDHIAAMYFGDPERFWVLCDANNAISPAELTLLPGQSIRITLPEGIPGGQPGV